MASKDCVYDFETLLQCFRPVALPPSLVALTDTESSLVILDAPHSPALACPLSPTTMVDGINRMRDMRQSKKAKSFKHRASRNRARQRPTGGMGSKAG
ncbi:hypothetical protein KIPB_013414, partial [Kipferlia bialata]|eukprot:g13414.t1